MYKSLLTLLFICIVSPFFAQVLGNSAAVGHSSDSNFDHSNAQFVIPPQISQPVQARVGNMEHMTVKVNGLHNAKPSGFLAIFNIIQTGRTTFETDSLYQARYEAFRFQLFKLGVEEKDVYTDFISFLPIYEVEKTKKIFSTKYEEVPKGFEMQKNVHIRMNDPKQLDPIISAAAAQGIYDLVKVEYFVSDQEQILDDLRKTMHALLQEKEKEFKALDIPLKGKWHMLGDTWNVHYPMQRYMSYTAKTRYSLDDIKEGATVNEVRVPKTQFYSKMDYNSFDVVVFPEFVDPVVQFTYSLIMEYEVLRPKPEPKPVPAPPTQPKEIKTYILITPDGKTQQLSM